ncbi:hypothetical protein B0H13DRAFT_1905096 [Mycena leptocephala]|nr:hypothetical protein B0H13DRAFT_1905096 [Mycena leptocephala]
MAAAPQEPCCTPTFIGFPNGNTLRHSQSAKGRFYIVTKGYKTEIFADEITARDQVEGFSNGGWKMEKTEVKAMQVWDTHCRRFHHHDHDNDDDTEPLPPPSPSPPPPPPPPPPPARRGARLRICPARSDTVESWIRECAWHSVPHALADPIPHALEDAALTLQDHGSYCVRQIVAGGAHASAGEAPSCGGFLAHGAGAVQPPVERFWGVKGVHIIFDNRLDAIGHIFDLHLNREDLRSSRNVRKLSAFITQTPYIREAEDPESSEDDF